jgi:hypothetical protein
VNGGIAGPSCLAVDIDLTDPEGVARYRAAVPPLLALRPVSSERALVLVEGYAPP